MVRATFDIQQLSQVADEKVSRVNSTRTGGRFTLPEGLVPRDELSQQCSSDSVQFLRGLQPQRGE